MRPIDGPAGIAAACPGFRRLTKSTRADLRGFRCMASADAAFQTGEGTANAVWVYAHPGFKSPSLRHLTRESLQIGRDFRAAPASVLSRRLLIDSRGAGT
jgi:hypothetical protein